MTPPKNFIQFTVKGIGAYSFAAIRTFFRFFFFISSFFNSELVLFYANRPEVSPLAAYLTKFKFSFNEDNIQKLNRGESIVLS